MKNFLALAALLACIQLSFSQANPTLAVGLETLTMNKGTIDVKALTEIIMEKQKELKQEALKRFMFKLFPDANYTTKFYVQNCLNVLLNEKNPQVIEKEILELTTNYALALGTAYALVKSKDSIVLEINDSYIKYKPSSLFYKKKVVRDYENLFKKKKKLLCLEMKKFEHENNLNKQKEDTTRGFSNFKAIEKEQNDIERYKRHISRIKLRNQIAENDQLYQLSVNALKLIEACKKDISLSEQILDDLRQAEKHILHTDLHQLKILLNKTKWPDLEWAQLLRQNIKAICAVDPFKPTPVKYATLYYTKKLISAEFEKIKDEYDRASKSTAQESSICKNSQEIIALVEQLISKDNIQNSKADLLRLRMSQFESCYNAKIPPNEFNKHVNAIKLLINEIVNPIISIEIPFGQILDVASLSLSEMEELQKKGFFKNKIDYRSDGFYKSLAESTEGKQYQITLDTFKLQVCRKINPYVKHYYIIKEFLKKGDKSFGDIINMLREENFNKSVQFLNSKSAKVDWVETLLKNENEDTNKEVRRLWQKIVQKKAQNGSIIAVKNAAEELNTALSSKRLSNNFDELNAALNSAIDQVNALVDQRARLTKLYDYKEYIGIQHVKNFIDTTEENSLQHKLIAKVIDDYNALKDKDFKAYKKLTIALEEYTNATNDTLNEQEIGQIQSSLKTVLVEVKAQTNQILEKANAQQAANDDENKKDFKTITTLCKSFYDIYLNDLLETSLSRLIEGDEFLTTTLDTATVSKASKSISGLYTRLKEIVDKKEVELKDILFLEDTVIAEMIELKVRDGKNDAIYGKIITDLKAMIPFLKIKILQSVELGDYNEELMTLFEFISNLNKLDRAQTYQSIIDMLRDGSKKVEENLSEGEFKNSYVLFVNAMKKYTIINPKAEKEYVEVDVVSFLNDLQQYYGRNSTSRFGLYLTLGLNQNFFLDDFTFPDATNKESIDNISFASEKIGVKYRIHSFKQFKGYENVVKDDVYLNKRAPFVNELYGIAYGSGLLYSLANTSTNENFAFPHVGLGAGVRFYNALDLNVFLGFPFVKNSGFFEHTFWGFGLDIPLGEYLEKIGN